MGIVSTSKNFIRQLDQIFYTINCLEKLDLISIQKNGDNLFIGYEQLFDGYKERREREGVGIIMYLMDEIEKKCFWCIKIKPTLLHYKKNGYMTDEEKLEHKKRWFSFWGAILATILTVVLTRLFTK